MSSDCVCYCGGGEIKDLNFKTNRVIKKPPHTLFYGFLVKVEDTKNKQKNKQKLKIHILFLGLCRY